MDGEQGCLMALSLTLAYRMRVYGQEDMYKLLTGSFTAQVGRNIEGGCAGDDGVCRYGMVGGNGNGSVPLLVQPVLAECRFACG